MWISYCVLLSLLSYRIISGHVAARQRRYLLFTPATQWGVFATVSTPLHPETSVSVAWFFEANYYNVDNASYFDPLLGDVTVSRDREGRSTEAQRGIITRRSLYIFIESMLQRHGHQGRPCLLRAICENASSHFLHNGLLGDLFHLVFTPSTSMAEDDIEDCYYEAEYRGLDHQCEHYNENCPTSPLEYITVYIEELL